MRIKLQHAERSVGFAGNDIEQFEPDPTRFYFEIQADGNHETLATSEIYNDIDDARYAIRRIVNTQIFEWTFVDETGLNDTRTRVTTD